MAVASEKPGYSNPLEPKVCLSDKSFQFRFDAFAILRK